MTGPRDAGEREKTDPAPLPADADTGSGDGLLDSIGKAITAPVRGAAEADEPGVDPAKPPQSPG